jgi:hypothetical protein
LSGNTSSTLPRECRRAPSRAARFGRASQALRRGRARAQGGWARRPRLCRSGRSHTRGALPAEVPRGRAAQCCELGSLLAMGKLRLLRDISQQALAHAGFAVRLGSSGQQPAAYHGLVASVAAVRGNWGLCSTPTAVARR